jgi:hypothetical protein
LVVEFDLVPNREPIGEAWGAQHAVPVTAEGLDLYLFGVPFRRTDHRDEDVRASLHGFP